MGPKVLAGANAYIKRTKQTNLAMEIVLKVLERGPGETSCKKFPLEHIPLYPSKRFAAAVRL